MTATANEKPQANTLHGPNLILDVENFGPIAEAKNIEFKPMTVFVGPSNTGKTYLATLLHAVIRPRQSILAQLLSPSKATRNFNKIINDFNPLSIYEDVQPLIEANVIDPREDDTVTIDEFPILDLSKESRTKLQHARHDFLRMYAKDALDEIKSVFEISTLTSILTHNSDREKRPNISVRDHDRCINLSISDGTVVHSDVHKPLSFTFVANDFPFYFYKNPDRYSEYTSDIVFEAVETYITEEIEQFPNSFYFRAGRSGILDMHREWTSQLIANAASVPLRRDSKHPPAFNIINMDLLQMLISARPYSKRPSKIKAIHRIADVIESSLLEGRIAVEDSSGITNIGYEQYGHVIPIERASSKVTELAPILLFFRQFVNEGDLLIIDEPEAHLHPAAQQQMAAALAFMVRSGLRVLITTHSHYMVEQLGNFVAVSTLDEDLRKRVLKLNGSLGEEDIYLDESEVAVYDFAIDKPEHGSIVETVEFNQDYGYFPRDHNWAIADQMNRTRRVIEARIDQDDPVVKR